MIAAALAVLLGAQAAPPAAAPPPTPQAAAIPLGAAYDPGNPFANILRNSRASVVGETAGALAFMDHKPALPGHVLVIPKAPVVSLLDATPAQLGATMALAHCVAIAQRTALSADGLTGIALRQNNGAPNQHVGHIHFHLVPLYGVRPDAPPATPLTPAQLEPMAARLRAAMPRTGC